MEIRHLRLSINILLLLTGILIGGIASAQDAQSQLAQRIMLENHIRSQTETALRQALGDEKFIVSVLADLNFTPSQRSSTVWEPARKRGSTEISREGEGEFVRAKPDLIPEDFGPPPIEFEAVLPGFPEMPVAEEEPEETVEDARPIKDRTETPVEEVLPEDEPSTQMVSYSIERTMPSIPDILKLDITVMLEDGVSQTIIDIVRRVVPIASGMMYERGDNLSVVTASFLEKEAVAQLAVEVAQEGGIDTTGRNMEEELAERMRQLEENQRQMAEVKNTMEKLPLYIIGPLVGLMLLALLIWLLGRLMRRKDEVPENGTQELPEPPAGWTPAEVAAAKDEARAAKEAAAARERAGSLARDVQRAEMKNTRQAIITLSVGSPDTASKIMSGWLESEAGSEGEAE